MPRIALNDPQVPYIGIDTDADNYLDKVPVALYGPNGEVLLVKTPTGETSRVIGSAIYGSDGTDFRPVKLDASGRMEAVLTGSTVDLRGLAASRPVPNSVAIGTTYWSVDTGDVHVSDGSTWRLV